MAVSPTQTRLPLRGASLSPVVSMAKGGDPVVIKAINVGER